MKPKLPANHASSKAPLHHPRDSDTHYQPTDNPMMHDWLQLGVRFYNPEIGRFERRDDVAALNSDQGCHNGRRFHMCKAAGVKARDCEGIR